MIAEQQHPLLLPVIVNVLMDYIPTSMWKTCRLVSKPWHDELLPRWRKQMKVCIGGLGKNKRYLTKDEDDKKVFMDVSSFLSTYQPKDVRKLEKLPFRSVETIAGRVTIGGIRRVQERFWNLCGSWLHHLHFHGVLIIDVVQLKNIIYRLTPNLKELELSDFDIPEPMKKDKEKNDLSDLASYLPGNILVQPNLKILKISLRQDTWKRGCRSYFGEFPLSFLNLFSVFINVEELCLKDFLYVSEFIQYLLDVIKTIREKHQNSVLNFKKLDLKSLHRKFTSDLVRKLCALSLPLEELHLDVEGTVDELRLLSSKFVALKKLSLHYKNTPEVGERDRFSFQLDVLPQTLTELRLENYVFDKWEFLASTPNLIKLDVRELFHYDVENLGNFPVPEPFPQNRTPLLEYLTTFSYSVFAKPIETYEIFTRIMPNVMKLILSADCYEFELVCNAWPQLTHWEIPYAEMDEATFVANINKLTNLTCLKLNVGGDKPHDGFQIMDGFRGGSIQKGFLMMPKLKRLWITFPHRISKRLLKELYEKVEDTKEVYVVKDKKQEEKYPLKHFSGNDCEESTVRIIHNDRYLL